MLEPAIQVYLCGRETEKKGFVVAWRTPAGVVRSVPAANRTVLARVIAIEAAPEVRGDLPIIDEVIDIHAPTARRQGDS